jgi:hypothetical protein
MFRSRTVSSQPVLRTALALFADLLRLLRLMFGPARDWPLRIYSFGSSSSGRSRSDVALFLPF